MDDRLVAGKDEQRCSRLTCGGYSSNHIREAGAFGPGTGRQFSADPDEPISRMCHVALMTARNDPDALVSYGMDDAIIPWASEDGCKPLLHASFRKHIR